MRIKNFLLVLLLFCYYTLFSQQIPPINIFTSEDYGAENQNWAISQSSNDFIYVANNIGLLEFNGSNWQLYKTPNKTIMRSVCSYKDKVFTGFYMDFGFWKKNPFGVLEYSSLVKSMDIKMLQEEDIWNIIEIDGWVLFKSFQRIYLYNIDSEEIKIIEAKNSTKNLSKVNDVIYFQKNNEGLFKIENGAPLLISENSVLKDNIVVNIFEKENNLLILTQTNGFYFLKGKNLIKWNLPFNILKDKKVYSAKKLIDNSFLLGTISNGLININNQGQVIYQIDKSSGLSNNTILSIFEDKKNNIWLGLDNGINCINNKSPFKSNSTKSDYLGTIYTSIVFDSKLYLGTNQGLFYKELNSKDSFKLIKKTQGQVWFLTEIDDELFCGHDSGTFLIKDNSAISITDLQGTWVIKKINETTIIQGCYDGLYILKKNNNLWKLRNKISGFDDSSRYLVLSNNKIFVNHEYKGVFKIDIDNDFFNAISVVKESTLEKGTHSSLVKFQNKVLYASQKGVFLYNESKDNFKKDTIYSKLIDSDNFISAKLIYSPIKNRLWSFSKDQIYYLTLGKLSNRPKVKSISISEFIPKGASGYENIIHLANEKHLIGTTDGYIEMDLNSLIKPKDFSIYINKVISSKLDGSNRNLNLSIKSELNYKENNIELFFSIPNFNNITTTQYQYQLLGQDMKWSSLSKASSILFKNISYGVYKFKVRGLVAGKYSSNEASYEFIVKRPWYFSNVFISIYILLFLLFLYMLHVGSKRYYKNQREELIEKTRKELELKELESSQEIIKIKNEKLQNDIENKNRELATSTMNIIKKNEFLNSIKSELVTTDKDKYSKVVRIIDKNLNNTDDWKLFQEAFNNADRKFLDKLKEKHPGLTPNDLRLCAYLRLNLSSKEIAPLLNISPRSVEVKRYRLRKKMALAHDANLTNYILEL